MFGQGSFYGMCGPHITRNQWMGASLARWVRPRWLQNYRPEPSSPQLNSDRKGPGRQSWNALYRTSPQSRKHRPFMERNSDEYEMEPSTTQTVVSHGTWLCLMGSWVPQDLVCHEGMAVMAEICASALL